MEPHIDVITLAVGDLDRSLAFYRDGLILALYPRSELAKDAEIPFGPPKTGELSIGHLVGNRAEVGALLAQAEEAGAASPSCASPPNSHDTPSADTAHVSARSAPAGVHRPDESPPLAYPDR